jgi:hypothetical protein
MPKKPAPAFKPPKSLAACADLLYSVREERLAAQKVADALKEKETLLQEHLINNLPKSQAGGIIGKLASVVLDSKVVPKVEDWDALYKYVLKTKSFSFLQRRLSETAIQEIWDNGKEVPGVSQFKVVVLRLRKRS